MIELAVVSSGAVPFSPLYNDALDILDVVPQFGNTYAVVQALLS